MALAPASSHGVGSQNAAFSFATVGSPAAAAETVIASVTMNAALSVAGVIYIFGFVVITIGASGTAVNLRIRSTDINGAQLIQSTAVTVVAGNVYDLFVMANATTFTLPSQVYVLTATVTNGAATSTVGKTGLIGLAF